jgi:hypothetical protein
MYTDANRQTAKREVRYTVQPDPYDAEPGDNFGFDGEWLDFSDSKTFSPTQQTDI